MKKLLVSGVLAVIAALVWNTLPASAHHPEVSVVTLCPGGNPTIDVTAEAWDSSEYSMGDEHRINTSVRIDVQGPGVTESATGQFVAPNYSFTSRFTLPTSTIGQTLTVRVTALANWGPNGEYPSQPDFAETTVTIQPPCEDDGSGGTSTTVAPTTSAAPSTTTAPTTEAPTTSAAPSTTTAPTTEAPTSTVAPVDTTAPSTAPTTAAPTPTNPTDTGSQIETEVAGIVEVRPQVPDTGAAAAQTGGQLAFTGRDTGPLVLGSAGLLAIGAGLMLGARKRRQAA